MKIYLYLILSLFFASCSTVTSKNLTNLEMKFAPLPAIPSGDYEAEATLSFKRNMVKDKAFLKNYRQASLASKVQKITIDLNQNTLFGKIRVWFYKNGSIKSGLKLASDPTYDLALYNLAEKYPNIDYWTNIRVERKVSGRKRIINGSYIKTGDETVIIKATGVEIMTDEEYETFKKTPEFLKMKKLLDPEQFMNF
jgi:hypothetical protein